MRGIVLTVLIAIGIHCAGQTPTKPTPTPPAPTVAQQPPTPELSKTQQLALKSVVEELSAINDDFRHEHQGWTMRWQMTIVQDTPPAAPAKK
jgi:hypothetical protein